MAGTGLSIVNLLGVATYLATALVAIAAGIMMGTKWRPFGPAIWFVTAALFVILAVFRLAGAEEHMRQAMRGALIAQREYGERRVFQGAAAIASLVLIGVAVVTALPRMVQWPQWRAIIVGSLSFVTLLYLLRIVSLHGTDRILYASIGPVHLNYLLELVPLAAIWFAAWTCIQGPPTHRRRERPPEA